MIPEYDHASEYVLSMARHAAATAERLGQSRLVALSVVGKFSLGRSPHRCAGVAALRLVRSAGRSIRRQGLLTVAVAGFFIPVFVLDPANIVRLSEEAQAAQIVKQLLAPMARR
jgi:hypothetical protein